MSSSSQWQSIALRALRAAFAQFVSATSEKGHYEVERKFALEAGEADALPGRIQQRGFTYAGTASMTDVFLPTAVDGEMLRVRKERIGDAPKRTFLTFKQWVQTASGKERKETEREVPLTVGALWKLAGRAISGEPLLAFSKQRKLYHGRLGDAEAVISIDDVTGLGQFSGAYMEVEVLVPLDGDVVATKDKIYETVRELLGGERSEARSYMEMLKQSRKQ
jgi:predicted adenylyl cyclase CyaB